MVSIMGFTVPYDIFFGDQVVFDGVRDKPEYLHRLFRTERFRASNINDAFAHIKRPIRLRVFEDEASRDILREDHDDLNDLYHYVWNGDEIPYVVMLPTWLAKKRWYRRYDSLDSSLYNGNRSTEELNYCDQLYGETRIDTLGVHIPDYRLGDFDLALENETRIGMPILLRSWLEYTGLLSRELILATKFMAHQFII